MMEQYMMDRMDGVREKGVEERGAGRRGDVETRLDESVRRRFRGPRGYAGSRRPPPCAAR